MLIKHDYNDETAELFYKYAHNIGMKLRVEDILFILRRRVVAFMVWEQCSVWGAESLFIEMTLVFIQLQSGL